MRLTFHGAVRTVTGSLHVVETAGQRVYLDCGLFQGRRAESAERNRTFPTAAADVDAVILSHAHLDHCGNLPTLVASGFRGPIYCTPATRDLTALVLRDAAKVQAQDTDFVNRIRRRKGEPAVEPLYDAPAAERAIRRLVSIPYDHPFHFGAMTVTYRDAGHILGSAMVLVEAEGRRLGFTGDLGRPDSAIIRDPEVMPDVDVLITESTYGNREHLPRAGAVAHLTTVIKETAARGGVVLIPAFAIGRTQEVVYVLHTQREAGALPRIDAYVDSPMAIDATDIFRVHAECFDDDVREHLEQHDPFGFKGLHYVRADADSKALNEKTGPFVVVATSGMAEAGRILHHLRHHIGDPRSTVLFVGYQAEHTLGRRLEDGVSPVRIYGEPYEVKIRVERADAFSAHADRHELLAWARRVPRIGRAFCVHGDEAPATAYAAALTAAGIPASVPVVGQAETV
jgi:metallo-beta-lactamase family protein